ncbi:hypothetical protein Tco_0707465 [Tanacetum coccineum]|uniref:Uncharacterized protein n=1 Tax=Tanacetum coccineum TaxID=301880 RepID=A0ABQ4YAA4_9ASTR
MKAKFSSSSECVVPVNTFSIQLSPMLLDFLYFQVLPSHLISRDPSIFLMIYLLHESLTDERLWNFHSFVNTIVLDYSESFHGCFMMYSASFLGFIISTKSGFDGITFLFASVILWNLARWRKIFKELDGYDCNEEFVVMVLCYLVLWWSGEFSSSLIPLEGPIKLNGSLQPIKDDSQDV